jgi:hypothetical protein
VLYASGDQETITIGNSGKANISSTRSGEVIKSLTLGASGIPILIGCKAENALLLSLKVDGSGSPTLRDAIDGYIPIGSFAEFKLINESANLGNKYKQENDIDLLSEDWVPIGNNTTPFTGEYDGGEYEITNLKVDVTTDRVGLFGITNNATLRNIRLVSGTVNGGGSIGGICGGADGSTAIINSHSGIAVTGTSYNIGGICGYVGGTTTIISCRNTGNVKSTGATTTNIGGIVGHLLEGATIKVRNCNNSGEIEGYAYIGGIAGISNATTAEITACRNSGVIKDAGGAISGGIIGTNTRNKTLTITACYNTGAVNHSDGSSNFSGGIIGHLETDGTLIACYNTGTVTGSNVNLIGLICGYYNATITSSDWTKGSSDATKGAATTGPDTTKEFSATAWPAAAEQGWGTGDGSEANTYWKSRGGWNGGTPEYPTLWWE